jgi:hypothetical protein
MRGLVHQPSPARCPAVASRLKAANVPRYCMTHHAQVHCNQPGAPPAGLIRKGHTQPAYLPRWVGASVLQSCSATHIPAGTVCPHILHCQNTYTGKRPVTGSELPGWRGTGGGGVFCATQRRHLRAVAATAAVAAGRRYCCAPASGCAVVVGAAAIVAAAAAAPSPGTPAAATPCALQGRRGHQRGKGDVGGAEAESMRAWSLRARPRMSVHGMHAYVHVHACSFDCPLPPPRSGGFPKLTPPAANPPRPQAWRAQQRTEAPPRTPPAAAAAAAEGPWRPAAKQRPSGTRASKRHSIGMGSRAHACARTHTHTHAHTHIHTHVI